VLSDIHANAPALAAVLADVDALGADGLLCLGDVVGYGADPGPVLDTVATRAQAVVAGNHDHGAVGLLDLEWFNVYARRAAEWTAERLSEAQARFLHGLPLVVEHGGATLVHASPRDPGAWTYLTAPSHGAQAFPAFRTRLCFVGHSHVPAVWRLSPDGTRGFRLGAGTTALAPGARYLVNVGSVGQPRDGDPQAAYAVWDLDRDSVEVRRVAYDAEETRRRIHAAGLPRILGDRLLRGR
jgi:diadenosine tetraphosphatase ApaH/serine/threonine PP2A family protein phosphatase